jgi:hypothetical protein
MAEQTEKDEQHDEQGGEGKADYQAEAEKASKEMDEFEQRDELPSDLKEWPDGKAKYTTFDSEGEEPYGEGLTEKLGPPITHHDDGSVSVEGKGKVDNPDDYKGEPIPLALEEEDPDFQVSGARNNPGQDDDDSSSSKDDQDSEAKES